MDKVVFLKLLPSSFIPESAIHASKCRDGGAGVTFTGDLLDSRTRGKSAVIVKRTGGYFSIQGYAPVPYREKHRCCSIFRVRAGKSGFMRKAWEAWELFVFAPFGLTCACKLSMRLDAGTDSHACTCRSNEVMYIGGLISSLTHARICIPPCRLQ